MIPVSTLQGKTVALFGLGGSGLSTAAALKAGGAVVTAWDDNPASVAAASAKGINTQDLRTIDFKSFDALILAPGVPLTHPKPHWSVELANSHGIDIIGDIELFCRERDAHASQSSLIAITGTNGKSTTTALIAHILKQAGKSVQLGGNIGTAVLSLDLVNNDQVFVVECSSYQIDLAPGLNPTTGVLLNISPDHLDRHGTLDNYASIKARLISGSDNAIVGIDDRHCAQVAEEVAGNGKNVTRVSVLGKHGANLSYCDGAILENTATGEQLLFDLAKADSLRGSHNGQNAACAIAACRSVGLTMQEISGGLISFPGLAHRMQILQKTGQLRFVNDSKATNAEAAEHALRSFERIYWIAGGRAKQGGIESLRHLFPKIAKAYLIGEAKDDFANTLEGSVPYDLSGTLQNAVFAAAADAKRDVDAGSSLDVTILLSPACASFDQFPNFELRGDAFCAAVKELELI